MLMRRPLVNVFVVNVAPRRASERMRVQIASAARLIGLIPALIWQLLEPHKVGQNLSKFQRFFSSATLQSQPRKVFATFLVCIALAPANVTNSILIWCACSEWSPILACATQRPTTSARASNSILHFRFQNLSFAHQQREWSGRAILFVP